MHKPILSGTIDVRLAMGVAVFQAVANTAITVSALRGMKKEYEAALEDSSERLHVAIESINFLLDRADDRTIVELDEKLQYWRIILGIDPSEREES
jgi:hypothetical protein